MATELLKRLSLEGILSDQELNALLVRRALFAEPIPVALAAIGLATQTAIQSIFERMGFIPASRLRPAPICKSLPRGILRTFWALPVGENSEAVIVAMTDPTDTHALRELAFHCKREIDPRVADMDQLRSVLFEVDPPQEGRQITRPAFGQVQSEAQATAANANAWSAPTQESLQEVVGMIAPRERSVTPSYGQPAVQLTNASWSKGTGNLVRMEGLAGSAIGAFAGSSSSASLTASPTGIHSATPTNGATLPTPIRSATLPPPPLGALSQAGSSQGARRPESDNAISIRARRPAKTPAKPSSGPASRESLQPLTELRAASDRDQVARICVNALTALAERAAFFVVKKGVIQGWDGSSAHSSLAGISKEALRNLWIPQTTRSVFRLAIESKGIYAGKLSDSSADSILAAALGGRPTDVIVSVIEVRSRVVGFLYADPFADSEELALRMEELSAAAAEALERWLLEVRPGR